MNSPPDLPPQTGQDSDDQPDNTLLAYAIQAATYLSDWRSRFSDNDTELITAEYPDTKHGHISVQSIKAGEVLVKVLSSEAQTAYNFNERQRDLDIETTLDSPSAEPDILVWEKFARILFDCDRTELRRHKAEPAS